MSTGVTAHDQNPCRDMATTAPDILSQIEALRSVCQVGTVRYSISENVAVLIDSCGL